MTPTAAVIVVHVAVDATSRADVLAVEEPLELRLGYGPLNDRRRATLAVTMRTPGQDADLIAGFAVAEGLLADARDLLAITPVAENVIRLDLHPWATPDLSRLERHGVLSSSCGLCGKTTLDAIERQCDPLPLGSSVAADVIRSLPEKLRLAQPTFDRTGGLHAAALFTSAGELLATREDIGRHNAVDKLIGSRLAELPLHRSVLFVSGRASFELVQKAAAAGVTVFAAVGAPSSLAVALAERVGMTLAGFVRDGRFNVYAGMERIQIHSPQRAREGAEGNPEIISEERI